VAADEQTGQDVDTAPPSRGARQLVPDRYGARKPAERAGTGDDRSDQVGRLHRLATRPGRTTAGCRNRSIGPVGCGSPDAYTTTAPAELRHQIRERITALKANPDPSDADHDTSRDSWTTTFGDGVRIITYAVSNRTSGS